MLGQVRVEEGYDIELHYLIRLLFWAKHSGVEQQVEDGTVLQTVAVLFARVTKQQARP